jgi:hypothetical protein
MSLETYWKDYQTGNYSFDLEATRGGYFCPSCGLWIITGGFHACLNYQYPYYPVYYPQRNKTEEAYKILKALVEEKIIQEPDSFKAFCELIEKIAKVI